MNAPASSRRVLRLPVKELRRGGRVLSCTLTHFREAGDALVCAEGESFAYTPLTGTSDLFGAGGHLAAYRPDAGEVNYLDTPAQSTVPVGTEFLWAAEDGEGVEHMYACGNGIVQAHTLSAEGVVSCGLLTDCAVVAYHERLFAPNGRKVRFSALGDYAGEGWAADEAEQGMSSFTLSARGGKIVGAFAVHEKLCFLREYGVTVLTAYADVYNFRLTDLACRCGKILPHTAAVCCGDGYFFSERGLCVFDGSGVERAEGAADEEIDLSQPVRVSVKGSTLYAAVTKRGGGAALYAYDPAVRRGRYLCNSFSRLSAGEGAYLLREGNVYALGGHGLPQGGRCELALTLSLADLYEGEKRLEALVVEGGGTFHIRAAGEEGETEAEGRANVRIALPAAVRGECIRLHISSSEEDAYVRAVSLCVRREERL